MFSGDSLIEYPIILDSYVFYIMVTYIICHTINMFNFIFIYGRLECGIVINRYLAATC